MKKRKVLKAVVLCVSLLCLTACGRSETAENADKEQSEVVVDFAKMDVESEVEEISEADAAENSEISETDSQEDSELPEVPEELKWFDDCVFLGDSLINGLNTYNDMTLAFGNAQFICSAGLGYGSCQWDIDDENEVHPYYYGEKILLEDGVGAAGAKKAIIGMGMNDIGNYGIDQTMEYVDSFIQRLRSKYPDLKIYLETVTPMIPEKEQEILSNAMIVEFNDRLREFCKENSCGFLDTWSVLVDENGQLPYDLCGDPDDLGLHLTFEGDEIVANYIIHNVTG